MDEIVPGSAESREVSRSLAWLTAEMAAPDFPVKQTEAEKAGRSPPRGCGPSSAWPEAGKSGHYRASEACLPAHVADVELVGRVVVAAHSGSASLGKSLQP
jgi:hypothetical protein